MKRFTTIKFTMLAVIAGLFLTVSAQAATFTVDRTDDANASACTAAVNDCTLRGAITAANATVANDIINFDATIFNVARTITLGGTQLSIAVNSGTLTVNGTGATLLVISGNNLSTVLRNDNTTASVVINALTISNGSGAFGGGIANAVGGNLTLNNSVVRNNAASHTGGGFNNDGTLTLNNSTVSNNTASINGGGISNGGTTANGGGVTLNNSTVSTNSAPNGGGIDNGTFNTGSRLTLNSSTVSNNSASTGGGGIRNTNTGTTTLNNTIIANSTAGGDCLRPSGTVNASYSLIEQNLTCVNGTNSNNLTGDPNLTPLQNNGGSTQTHAFLLGVSIAIDKGNSTLSTDQRGFSRPVNLPNADAPGGNGSDIGAFEQQSAPTAAVVTVSGRVLAGGEAVSRARVRLTDAAGTVRYATTDRRGFYRFDSVAAGETYIFNASFKRFEFAPQVVYVTEDVNDLNFTGN